MYLSSDPHWSAAVQKEIETLIPTHSASLPSQTLTETLSSIPLRAWETQTPILDLCIRETLRIAQPYTALRKNVGPEITVGPYTIPSGALAVYPFSDTSLNPNDYPQPMRWDPSRDFQDDFIGWGAGKHACKGQRLGALSVKLLVSSVLMKYRVTLEMQGPPVPDWSSAACRPMERGGIKITAKP
jgi:sterol 14-demethylase